MPRRARIAIAGIPWHLIQRGNNRSACFYTEEDYRIYLQILEKQATKHGCSVHAYVLMTNHVHLLVTPVRSDSISAMMKNLGQCYVQYINRSYQRSGTLWEGRFRSCLAQSEAYVLTCYRYIELNPVRAGMVKHPREYPWSSHGANAYGKNDPLVIGHPEYLRLDSDDLARRKHYRTLFQAQMDMDTVNQIRDATNGNFALGNKRFVEDIEQMLMRRVTPGRPGRPAITKEE